MGTKRAMLERTFVPYHERFLDAAARIVDQSDEDDYAAWSAAVAMSGAACEAAAAYALQTLFAADQARSQPRVRGTDAKELLRLLKSKKTVNLKPKRQRALWRSLSDDKLSRWSDWLGYVRLVDRNTAIAHTGLLPSGKPATKRDAADALATARSFCAHLETVMRHHRTRPVSLA